MQYFMYLIPRRRLLSVMQPGLQERSGHARGREAEHPSVRRLVAQPAMLGTNRPHLGSVAGSSSACEDDENCQQYISVFAFLCLLIYLLFLYSSMEPVPWVVWDTVASMSMS